MNHVKVIWSLQKLLRQEKNKATLFIIFSQKIENILFQKAISVEGYHFQLQNSYLELPYMKTQKSQPSTFHKIQLKKLEET